FGHGAPRCRIQVRCLLNLCQLQALPEARANHQNVRGGFGMEVGTEPAELRQEEHRAPAWLTEQRHPWHRALTVFGGSVQWCPLRADPPTAVPWAATHDPQKSAEKHSEVIRFRSGPRYGVDGDCASRA